MRAIWPGTRIESVHDYVGVLVPLDEAHLHGHSARCGKTEFEEAHSDDVSDHGDDDAGKDGDDEGAGMLEMSAAEYSIEGLRKEVRRGERGKTWTEYESMKKDPHCPHLAARFRIEFDAVVYRGPSTDNFRHSEIEAYK